MCYFNSSPAISVRIVDQNNYLSARVLQNDLQTAEESAPLVEMITIFMLSAIQHNGIAYLIHSAML